MNRRDFLLNVAKVGGTAALAAQLRIDGLMAVPQDDARIPAAAWIWDGTSEGLLRRLNELVDFELAVRHRTLLYFPELERQSLEHLDVYMLQWSTNLPPEFLYGAAGTGPVAKRETCIAQGQALCPNGHADPVASLAEMAAGFADRLDAVDAAAYGDLYLPNGVQDRARVGMFRLVSVYDICRDSVPLRIDTLVGVRRRIVF